MRFSAQAPIDIAAVSKRLNSSLRRLYFVDADSVFAWVERQQVAQRGRWTFVNQFRVLLIIAVFAALHGPAAGCAPRPGCRHDIRRRAHISQNRPGGCAPARRVSTDPADPAGSRRSWRRRCEADHALEAELGDIAMGPTASEQLRAAVGAMVEIPHLGHDLIQTFIDTVAIVQHTARYGLSRWLCCRPASPAFRRRGMDRSSRRPKSRAARRSGAIAGAGGFNDDVGIAAQAFIDQTGLGSRQRPSAPVHRQTVFGDVAVREAPAARCRQRTICSALSHSAFTVSAEGGPAGLNVISRTSAR